MESSERSMPPSELPGGYRLCATDPNQLEQSSKDVRTADGYCGEDETNRHIIGKRRLQPEDREHQDLSKHRDGIADEDIGASLDQRHPARLLHR